MEKKKILNCWQTLVQEEGIWRVKPSLESVYLWSSIINSWADKSALGKTLQRKGVRRRVRLSSLLVKHGVCLWMQLGEVDLGNMIGEEEEAWMSLWKRVLCERLEKLFKAILVRPLSFVELGLVTRRDDNIGGCSFNRYPYFTLTFQTHLTSTL